MRKQLDRWLLLGLLLSTSTPSWAAPAAHEPAGVHEDTGAELKLIKAAIAQAGGINHFQYEMALGRTMLIEGKKVDLALVKQIWKDKVDAQWIEGEFRQEWAAMHEHIPSNMMPDVMNRGIEWVDLQNFMRTPTEDIIFNPAIANAEKDGKLLPQGHTASVELITSPDRKSTRDWLEDRQADFHDALRESFLKSKDTASAIKGAREIVAKWMWDGSAISQEIHPAVWRHLVEGPAKGSLSRVEMQKNADGTWHNPEQKKRFDAAMAMFDGMQAKLDAHAQARADIKSEGGAVTHASVAERVKQNALVRRK